MVKTHTDLANKINQAIANSFSAQVQIGTGSPARATLRLDVDGLFGIENASPASIYVYDELVAQHDAAARDMALATTIVGVVLLVVANRLTRRLRRG